MTQDIPVKEFKLLMEKALTEGRKTFLMFEDSDGNWRGESGHKDKGVVNVRAGDPQTVLTLLITHDGK